MKLRFVAISISGHVTGFDLPWSCSSGIADFTICQALNMAG